MPLLAAGLRVLLTHLERARCCPQLLARLARSAECCGHPEFCLFLCTELPVQSLRHGERGNSCSECSAWKCSSHWTVNTVVLSCCVTVCLFGSFSPEIHPLILAQVRVVDLSLSSEEIEGLMLTELLQSQCKQLLDQHLQLHDDKQSLASKVVSEEVRRLRS